MLYLPGQQARFSTTTTGTATTKNLTINRFYTLGNGQQIAARKNTFNPVFTLADPHNTTQLTYDPYSSSTNPIIKRRAFDPYGNPLTTPTTPAQTWVDDRAYLNKPHNPATGLTDLGARQYNPTTGRFTSVDPLLNPTDPLQANGYNYGNNNPIGFADPDGNYPVCNGDHCANSSPNANGTWSIGAQPTSGSLALDSILGGIKKTNQQASDALAEREARSTLIGSNPQLNSDAAFDTWNSALIGGIDQDGAIYASGGIACLGRAACDEALKYFGTHKDDLDGAINLAANYCFDNPSKCKNFDLISNIGTTLLALAGVGGALGKMRATKPAIGFTDDAVSSAYVGMNKGGGHAIRHLRTDGLISNTGSLASQVAEFQKLTSPILRSPTMAFNWRVGDTMSRAFAGTAGGRTVVVFVAKEGPYQGKVISAVAPDASKMAQWVLP